MSPRSRIGGDDDGVAVLLGDEERGRSWGAELAGEVAVLLGEEEGKRQLRARRVRRRRSA